MGRLPFLAAILAVVAAAQSGRDDFERFLSAPESEAAQRVEALLRVPDADLRRWALDRPTPKKGAAVFFAHPGDGPDALIVFPSGTDHPRTCLLAPTAPRGLDAFELRAAGAPFLAVGHALVAPMRRPGAGRATIDAGWLVGVERAVGLSHEGRVALLGAPWSELPMHGLDGVHHAFGAFHVALLGEGAGFDPGAAQPLRHQHWVFEHGRSPHPDTVRAMRNFAADAAYFGVAREFHPDPIFDLRPSSMLKRADRSSTLAAERPPTSPFKVGLKSTWSPVGRTGVLARARVEGPSLVVERDAARTAVLRVDNLLPGDAVEVLLPDLADARSPLDPPASFDAPAPTSAAPHIPEHGRLERTPADPRRDALTAYRLSLHLGWRVTGVQHLRVLN